QPPHRQLFGDAVVQQEDAVGDVLLQALPREGAVAALGGDDRGHAAVLEPAEQPAQFGPPDGLVGQPAEERLGGGPGDAACAAGGDGAAQADEQALQVVLAGLLDLAALDADVIDEQLLLLGEAVEVEAEGADVLGEFLGGLLEGEEDAGLAELGGATDEELQG